MYLILRALSELDIQSLFMFGPTTGLDAETVKDPIAVVEQLKSTMGSSGKRVEDARVLGRGWRQTALGWKPDQTLYLSE